MDCIFYRSDSYNPHENLAAEQFFFDTLEADCFVFYLWQNANTVVIGRNQNAYAECDVQKLIADGGVLARRTSGGGAVYHDLQNLNFTFIFNKTDYNAHADFDVIKNALSRFGLVAEVNGRNDISAGGRKFSGNAFYNSGAKFLHHGTLLVDADVGKMTKYLNVPKDKLVKHGVKSVGSRVVNLKSLCEAITVASLSDALCAAVKEVFSPDKFIERPFDRRAFSAYTARFENREFLYSDNASFEREASGVFEWGRVDLGFEIQGGAIKKLAVFSDSLFPDEIENAKKTIVGSLLSELTVKNKPSDGYKNSDGTLSERIADDIICLIKRSV